MKYVAGSLLFLAGCTVSNPAYIGGGPQLDGSMSVSDGGMHDLAKAPGPDLAAQCIDGQRTCLAASGSAVCKGGVFTLDRKCPMDSMCLMGICQPPMSGTNPPVGDDCSQGGGPQENQCFAADTSCDPFINANGGDIIWVCAAPLGQGVPGTQCTTGDVCRTGFCGSNGTCFRACQQDLDCPFRPNSAQRWRCADVQIVVDGKMVTASSCIP